MTVTPATFRTAFPEFADASAYPDATITTWIGFASKLLSVDRWSELLDLGTSLFVAHNLILATRDIAATSRGGAAGSGSGVVASKSVDKVSVSYDTGAATISGAGAWNLTTYGVRYLQLARMVGAGAVQISPGGAA